MKDNSCILLYIYFLVNALDREIILDVGYDLTPDNFHTKFLLSWASDSNIELDINWKDISRVSTDSTYDEIGVVLTIKFTV